MDRQFVVTSFQILDDEIAGGVSRDLPIRILIQRMNGYQGIRHYSTRSILYRAANASEGGLGLGSGEKNYASKQQCYGRIESRHAIPPASRSGLATAFCGIYRGARKEAVKISMKVIN